MIWKHQTRYGLNLCYKLTKIYWTKNNNMEVINNIIFLDVLEYDDYYTFIFI